LTAPDDICLLTLEQVGAEISARRLSPIDVTEAMLARIERLDPRLNSFITVTADQATAAAHDAEREIAAGRYRGALHGVPVAIKDLFATRGIRTTAGSKILDAHVPEDDATAVSKLRDAGAISLGKLGMHEWAYGTTSDNQWYGPVRNPWNTDHVPGGSSGGSGAATAACLAYATLGTDTGGSIRVPAAACGCVGLMPTYGRASLHGVVPLSWSLDHPGPLTRTVRDAAIVLRTISGADPRDQATEHQPVPDWLDGIERGAAGLRVGVPEEFFWDDLDPDVAFAARKALADLEAAGAALIESSFPHTARYAAAFAPVMFAEAAAYHAPNLPSRRDEYSVQVGRILDLGHRVSGIQYVEAMRVLHQARRGEADDLLEGCDVLATPTMPIAAPSIVASRERDPGARMAAFTSIFDLTGQPAISVPCGLTPAGLPVGLMLVARRWDESGLLRAARAYEQVRGPFAAPPLD